jgi:hypothetical protein
LPAHVFLDGHTEMMRKAATLRIQSRWKGASKEALLAGGIGCKDKQGSVSGARMPMAEAASAVV